MNESITISRPFAWVASALLALLVAGLMHMSTHGCATVSITPDVEVTEAVIDATAYIGDLTVDLDAPDADEFRSALVQLLDEVPDDATVDEVRAYLQTVDLAVTVDATLEADVRGSPAAVDVRIDSRAGGEVCLSVGIVPPFCFTRLW